jgi:hypothetical protein
MDYRKYKRNIYSPKMSTWRLENLLSKIDLSDEEKESLLDYHWLLISAPQWAADLGLMKTLVGGGQPVTVPKDVWWTINIEARTRGFESKEWVKLDADEIAAQGRWYI